MTWHSVRFVLECRLVGEPDPDRLYEDRIVVIQAADEEEARRKVEGDAQHLREEYQNERGNTVIWEFMEVLDVKPVFGESITEGTEVYSSLLDEQGLRMLRRMMRSETSDKNPAS